MNEAKNNLIEDYFKLLRNNNWKDINILIDQAIDKNIYELELFFRGKSSEKKEDFNTAIELYLKALEIDPNNVMFLADIGKAYLRIGNYNDAINYSLKALDIETENPIILNNIGNAYFHHGDYYKAQQYYENAIKVNSKYSEPYNSIGNIYYRKRIYDKALDYFQKALLMNPNSLRPLNGIGLVHLVKKEFDLAIKTFNKLLENNTIDIEVLNNLGVTYHEIGDKEKSIEFLNKALELNPNSDLTQLNLGNYYKDIGDYSKATEHYLHAKEINPKNAGAWFSLGIVNKDNGEYNKAIEYLIKSSVIDPYSPLPYNALGNVYKDLGSFNDAIECYEKAINIDLNFSDPWNGLGAIYQAKGEYKEAVRSFEKAIALDNNYELAYRNLGLTYILLGDYNKGIELLNNALIIVKQKNNLNYESLIKQDLFNINLIIHNNILLQQESEDPINEILKEIKEQGIEEQVIKNKGKNDNFIEEGIQLNKSTTFEVLRRWNSYTPIISYDSYCKGGGYFIQCDGKGIVIDPGLNFIENFRNEGHYFYEIDYVIISHSHNDHMADLESILTLLYKYNSEIKKSNNQSKENTITRQIAQQKNIPIDDVDSMEVEEIFCNSPRRKRIHIYMPLSAFKKYEGYFQLFRKEDYTIHIIEKEQKWVLFDDIFIEVLAASHKDLLSDIDSTAFIINIKGYNIIYTGDTGWNDCIEQQYKSIKDRIKKVDLLIANIGGFSVNEIYYLNQNYDINKAYYDNHLGRLGLAKINSILSPDICLISEFGEELKGYRTKISNIYQKAFKDSVLFFPADIGFKLNLVNKKVLAMCEINQGNPVYEFIQPEKIKVFENQYNCLIYLSQNINNSDLVVLFQNN